MEDNRILNEEALDQVSGGVGGSNSTYIKYIVVEGDTLHKLAKRFGTTVDDIMRMNPIIKDRDKIRIGWELIIPDRRG